MTETKNLKLGSLFDGIGGFPYAGSFFGIEPVWASEIMPSAISVTRRHGPLSVSPTVSATYGAGGGNIPSVLCAEPAENPQQGGVI